MLNQTKKSGGVHQIKFFTNKGFGFEYGNKKSSDKKMAFEKIKKEKGHIVGFRFAISDQVINLGFAYRSQD